MGLALPDKEGAARLIKMTFRTFVQQLIMIPAQIKTGGRKLTYRLLSYNRWVKLLLVGSQRLRCLRLA